jgi:hypothetical protein
VFAAERPGASTKSASATGRERGGLCGQPRLYHADMRCLRWWATLSANPHVGREFWPAPTAAIFKDARIRGWGVICNGQVPACGFFDAA